MIGYTTIGTNDFERGVAFYDELLKVFGAKRMMESDKFVAWGVSPDKPLFSLTKPYDEKPATVGNGVMIALSADSQDVVNAFHAKALELGGADEGQPGDRGDSFYAAYIRDLDGNKLAAFLLMSN